MAKLPKLTGKELAKIAVKLGFVFDHQTGSHMVFKHPDGRRTVVPVHANEDLGKGLLREILKQVNLSKEDYEELRRKV